jgi:hypothetical protein
MTHKNWHTWIGHGLQGVAVGLVYIVLFLSGGYFFGMREEVVGLAYLGAALALFYHFSIRELMGFWQAFGKRERVLIWDSVLDFVSPFLGLIAIVILYEMI